MCCYLASYSIFAMLCQETCWPNSVLNKNCIFKARYMYLLCISREQHCFLHMPVLLSLLFHGLWQLFYSRFHLFFVKLTISNFFSIPLIDLHSVVLRKFSRALQQGHFHLWCGYQAKCWVHLNKKLYAGCKMLAMIHKSCFYIWMGRK